MLKIVNTLFVIFLYSNSLLAVSAPYPITSDEISFKLIANEPGPEWSCWHSPIPNLLSDWKVICKSLNSSAIYEFMVHFLVRVSGVYNNTLEVLYWVDEIIVVNRQKVNLSHGQSSLIEVNQNIGTLRLALGQFVQNGTSSLNVYFLPQKKYFKK